MRVSWAMRCRSSSIFGSSSGGSALRVAVFRIRAMTTPYAQEHRPRGIVGNWEAEAQVTNPQWVPSKVGGAWFIWVQSGAVIIRLATRRYVRDATP
jgi:hypothetical protein